MKLLLLTVLVAPTLSVSAFADNTAVQVRHEINTIFFNGAESFNFFNGRNGKCKVIVANQKDTTLVKIDTDRMPGFAVTSTDTNIVRLADHHFDQGVLSVLSDHAEFESLKRTLKIEKKQTGSTNVYKVTTKNGHASPVSCTVRI